MHNKKFLKLLSVVTMMSLSVNMTAGAAQLPSLTSLTAGASAIEGVSFAPTKEVVPSETEQQSGIAIEKKQTSQILAAGAGNLMDAIVVAPEDEDVQDDQEEDVSGTAYGYTNLGVANVEDHLNIRETTEDDSKIVGKMTANAGCEEVWKDM